MNTQPPVHGFLLSVNIKEEEARRAGTSLDRIAHALRVQLSAMLPAATTEYTYLVARAANPRGARPRLSATRRPPAEQGLVVDLQRQQARIDGRDASLSQREFELLRALLVAGGAALSRSELIDRVWGSDEAGPRVVDVTIRRLRSRLSRHGGAVRTVRGIGYRFDAVPGVAVLGEEYPRAHAS